MSHNNKLSDKAQAALDKVIAKFQTGDLSALVRIATIQHQGDPIPSDSWSFANKVLAYIQTGAIDCRGFNQWKDANRSVKKGSSAAFIFAPRMVRKVEKGDDGEESERQVLIGFLSIPVFADHATDGEALPAVDYSPAELPPLMDMAQRLGVKVNYQPGAPDRLGSYRIAQQEINLGTHDTAVFFHELAHAAHDRIEKLKGGQNEKQETVAEFTAAVLMELYGVRDHTGNAWQYIASYNSDPLKAIMKALSTIEKVLAVITASE